MSRTSLDVPFFLLKTDLICKMWILLIRTYWCKILLDCLHDALHGAGLDYDDEVSQLKGEELRFQHLLLLDLLDFNLLQTDAVHAWSWSELLVMFPCHDQLMIITCSISPKTVLREHYARLLDPLRTEVRGVQVSARRQGAGQRVRQQARARAALHHHAAWPQLQLQAHHRPCCIEFGSWKIFQRWQKIF